MLSHSPYFPFASSGATSSFAFAVTVPGLALAPGPCGAPRRFAAVTALVDSGGRIAWPLTRVAHLGRLRRGHRSGRLRWEDRMASYSGECLGLCLGLPWRTAALGRLLWQDEATRYAVHGLALAAGWRCPTLGLR